MNAAPQQKQSGRSVFFFILSFFFAYVDESDRAEGVTVSWSVISDMPNMQIGYFEDDKGLQTAAITFQPMMNQTYGHPFRVML